MRLSSFTLFAVFLSSYYIYYMSIFKHIVMSHPVPKNVQGIIVVMTSIHMIMMTEEDVFLYYISIYFYSTDFYIK